MTFAFPIRVYWEDTDAGGIVFYANYLKFFERARTEWLRSLGIAQQQLRETHGRHLRGQRDLGALPPAGPPRRRTSCYGAASKIGPASLIIAQQAFLTQQRALLCEGTIRIGWVDADTLRPARIPLNILEATEPMKP